MDLGSSIKPFFSGTIIPEDYVAFVGIILAVTMGVFFLTRKKVVFVSSKAIALLMACTIIYMAVPAIMFIFSLPLDILKRIILCAVLLYYFAKAFRSTLRGRSLWEKNGYHLRVGFLLLFLGLMIVSYAGLFWERGFVGDWRMHRSKLISTYLDPVRPVVGKYFGYNYLGYADNRLYYYYASYLPVAYFARIWYLPPITEELSYVVHSLSYLYFMWNFIGLVLASLLLPVACMRVFDSGEKIRWGYFYLVLLTFSGLNYVYKAIVKNDVRLWHSEWSVPYFAQISSFISHWQWAPHHFIPGLLALVVICMYYRGLNRFPLVLWSTFTISGSVFAWIGSLPLLAYSIYDWYFRGGRKLNQDGSGWSKVELVAALLLVFVILVFYGSRFYPNPGASGLINFTLFLENGFMRYLLLLFVEFLSVVIILVLSFLHRIKVPQIVWFSLFVLFTLPLFQYLRFNDLVMRGIIPTLFLVIMFCGFVIEKAQEQLRLRSKILIALFFVIVLPGFINEYFYGLVIASPLTESRYDVRTFIGPDELDLPGILDVLHVLWAVIAWVAVNLFPGLVLYLHFKRRQFNVLEALGLALVLSPIINVVTHSVFGFMGAPLWFSIIFVQVVSWIMAVRVFRQHAREDDVSIQFDKREFLTVISTALILTLFLAIPSILNPTVRFRSDNQSHAGIINSIFNTGVPPQAPYMSGYLLYYYWLYDLSNAITAYASNVHPTIAIYIANCMGFFSLIIVMWLLSRSFGGNNTVNLMAVLFLTFGMNAYRGLEVTKQVFDGSLALKSLLGVGGVLHNLTGWGNASFWIGFLVGHPPAISLSFIVASFYCLSEYRKTRHNGYLIPLFLCSVGAVGYHPPTGIYYGIAMGVYTVFEFIFKDRRGALKVFAVLAIAALVLIPYNVQITSGKSKDIWGNYMRKMPSSSSISSDIYSATRYVLNPLRSLIERHLQVMAVFAVLGLIIGIQRLNLVLLTTLVSFLGTYVLFNTPGGGWKNTLLIMIPLSILASWSVVAIISRIPWQKPRLILYGTIVLLLIPTNVITVYGYANEKLTIIDPSALAAYSWMRENTARDSIFVFYGGSCGQFMSHSGRNAFFFDMFWRLHGYDEALGLERRKIASSIVGGKEVKNNTKKVCAITDGRPTYLFLSRGQVKKDTIDKFSDDMIYKVNNFEAEGKKSVVVEIKCSEVY